MWTVVVVILLKAAVVSEYALPDQYVNKGACTEAVEKYAATWGPVEPEGGFQIGFGCKKLPTVA